MDVKLTIKCDNCNTALKLKAKERLFGTTQTIKCPSCNHLITLNIPEYGAATNPTDSAEKQDSLPTSITSLNTNPSGANQSFFVELMSNESIKTQKFEIDQSYLTFGRLSKDISANAADLQVITDDMYISRRHCIFRKYETSITIEDTSQNGTFINGVRLDADDEMHLNEGDIIKMGNSLFKIILQGV
jgi:pSer/pThr/pTyr-binding forkhead associated (FHA) protein